MNLFNRCLSFYVHENVWWLASLGILFAQIMWKFWGHIALVPLLVGSAVAFVLPWLFCRRTALKFASWKRFLFRMAVAVIILSLWLRFKHEAVLSAFIFACFWSFTVGFLFWTVSDDIYEMISWLSHPLEYGRPPDEIYLLAQRRDAVALHRLWRYRYNDKWDVGITGLVTFAFGDGRCDAMSPDEILAEYLGWYEREEIGEMRDDAIDELLE